MKRIPLNSGRYALVDDDDYVWLSQWKWTENGNGYAWRARPLNEVGPRHILMHRLILGVDGVSVGVSGETDHLDRNRLNNQRHNLALVSHGGNQQNTAPRSASGVKGVIQRGKRWQAYASTAKGFRHLGLFVTKEEATLARKSYEEGLRAE